MQFYSQYKQDKYVYETFFINKKNGFFLEIGADDGIRFSNCKFFEDSLNWNGIAIEARSSAFDKLTKNRKCTCINAVLSDKEEQTSFLEIDGYGKGLSGLINKYDKRHVKRIEREKQNPKNKGSKITTVKTIKLSDVLTANNATKIDFLSIDTEGSELDILQTIDFQKINIDVITIEDNYNNPKLLDFFSERNYKLVKQIACDKVFKKNDIIL